ncbi:MAG: SWIM zinc finger domain-containing protein, partial [Chthoniobacterales bacterium]
MNAIPITEKLLSAAAGWQAMKAARDLLKAGRVTEASYEPPMLAGYVREGAKNYRSGLRIKSAVDVENVCSCWESRSAGKICSHSVAVGLAYLNPAPAPPPIAAAPAIADSSATDDRFVPLDNSEVTRASLHLILPPNFATTWQKGQIMIVLEAETQQGRTLVSPLPKTGTFGCDEADLALLEGLRAVPAIFASGMASLSRDSFLRLLPALQNHSRVTFGKGTPAAISSA